MAESDGSEEAAEAVENLLESYFMQIDGTYDRLVSICKFHLSLVLALSPESKSHAIHAYGSLECTDILGSAQNYHHPSVEPTLTHDVAVQASRESGLNPLCRCCLGAAKSHLCQ